MMKAITKEQRTMIISLRKTGKTYKEIAEATGVSQGTVVRYTRDVKPTKSAETKKATAKKKSADKSAGLMYVPVSVRALISALATPHEKPMDTVLRGLRLLAEKDEQEINDLNALPVVSKEESDALREEYPAVTDTAVDYMEGVKLTFGIAVLIGLVLLTLNQAGVL
jgi:transcriptional regulator with XRE-family HTH domain